MIRLIHYLENSNALLMSAYDGCHLCTLLLAEFEDPMMKYMQNLESEIDIKDKPADKSPQPSYQIELCGYLDERISNRSQDISVLATHAP